MSTAVADQPGTVTMPVFDSGVSGGRFWVRPVFSFPLAEGEALARDAQQFFADLGDQWLSEFISDSPIVAKIRSLRTRLADSQSELAGAKAAAAKTDAAYQSALVSGEEVAARETAMTLRRNKVLAITARIENMMALLTAADAEVKDNYTTFIAEKQDHLQRLLKDEAGEAMDRLLSGDDFFAALRAFAVCREKLAVCFPTAPDVRNRRPGRPLTF